MWNATYQAIPVDPKTNGASDLHIIMLIVLMDGTMVKPVVADEEPDEKSE
ncbi:MAG TPA: hypothetical protein VHC22_34020 [Pirellulales bacterium]|nr:hypothetical protein [Pirellulales bacterium]